MKTTKSKGRKRVVYLSKGQTLQVIPAGCTALIIRDDEMYKLGEQVDIVVHASLLSDATRVRWCQIIQGWVE